MEDNTIEIMDRDDYLHNFAYGLTSDERKAQLEKLHRIDELLKKRESVFKLTNDIHNQMNSIDDLDTMSHLVNMLADAYFFITKEDVF